MNYMQTLLSTAKSFIAEAFQELTLILNFQSVSDLLEPRSFNHQHSKNNIVSPLLIVQGRNITLMPNRLKQPGLIHKP